jgi:hypothetical protein
MDSSKRTPSNLILDNVLVDAVFRPAVLLVVCIFRPRIQRLLNFSVLRGLSTVVSERALVGRSRAALWSDSYLSVNRIVYMEA